MKICPKCNHQNANTASICKNCGENLNTTSTIEEVKDTEPEKTARPRISLLFALLSFAAGTCKEAIPAAMEEGGGTPLMYCAYFACFILSVLLLVLSIIKLRGIFKEPPVPTSGFAAMLLIVLCIVLIFLDVLSMPSMVSQFIDLIR
ncbi:MAG: hypothetical protein J5379_10185 [Clostridiales bacterium]|nr:hypothetical protein [Clostridiales bacterium]